MSENSKITVTERGWKIEADVDKIIIRDSTGTRRFVGNNVSLLYSWVWLMDEFDAVREKIGDLPARIERAIRLSDYEAEENKSAETKEDRENIAHASNYFAANHPYVHAAALARQEFIANLLRATITPLVRTPKTG